MALSEDFKAQLKAGNIADAMTMAISEAIELEITTWVSSPSDSEQPQPGHRMQTRINILDGEVETEVGSQFLGHGPYSELRQFHMQQVQQGRQSIEENLVSLQQMFTVLTNTLSYLPSSSHEWQQNQPLLSSSKLENLY